MGEMVEKRTVKIKIPEVLEEYYAAYKSEDYEDCQEILDNFYSAYNRLRPELQNGVKTFLKTYMARNRMDHKTDLGNAFKDII